MWNKKKIEKLEKEIKYLKETLNATTKFIKEYLKAHSVPIVFDYLFSTDNPLEEIYCYMKSIDERITKLENKKPKKKSK